MYGFRLPEDFLIGTGNSAFQSEGAWVIPVAEESDKKEVPPCILESCPLP